MVLPFKNTGVKEIDRTLVLVLCVVALEKSVNSSKVRFLYLQDVDRVDEIGDL